MKRFWREAKAARTDEGWQVMLDGRGVKTPGGRAQVVPSAALAKALAAEWAAQRETIDPPAFALRDLADYAIDVIAPDRAEAVRSLLAFGETDTLLYRAAAGDPVHARQASAWEPLVRAAEARWDVHFTRVTGVFHAPQPPATLARLEAALGPLGPFELAALTTLASLAASLLVGLAALDPAADIGALWAASELEEDFQVEQWGRDADAEARRARRQAAFAAAARFVRLLREPAG